MTNCRQKHSTQQQQQYPPLHANAHTHTERMTKPVQTEVNFVIFTSACGWCAVCTMLLCSLIYLYQIEWKNDPIQFENGLTLDGDDDQATWPSAFGGNPLNSPSQVIHSSTPLHLFFCVVFCFSMCLVAEMATLLMVKHTNKHTRCRLIFSICFSDRVTGEMKHLPVFASTTTHTHAG